MTNLSIPDFSILLGTVQRFWGNEIYNIRDCELLSEDIFIQTKERISPSTFFRWYVLKNHVHKPYKSTLNTLIKYLETKRSSPLIEPELINKSIFPDNQGVEFISLSLQQGEYKGLLVYLRKMPNFHVDIDHSIHFASRIGHEIRSSKRLQKELLPELIQSEQGRLYLVELFCDQDALDGYYHHALERYISIFPNKNQIKVLEDFLFAAHLLVQSYLLKNEFAPIKTLKLELDVLIPKIRSNYEQLHPMPKLRYHLMLALFSRISSNLSLSFENELLLSVEQLLNEFPLWKNALLFEFSKTVAILNWTEPLDYIASKISEPNLESLSSTFHYNKYTAKILNTFGNQQLHSPIQASEYKHIEYSKFNNHIIRIKQTLNNLK